MPGEKPDFTHPLMQGCVGMWLFNAGAGSRITNLADPTGNSDGIASGGLVWSGSPRGGAMAFDGVDDYVDVGDINATESIDSLSIGAWIKFSSLPSTIGRIVNKINAPGSAYNSWSLYILKSTYTPQFLVVNAEGSSVIASADTALNDGNWHYVVGVYNGANLLLYVDGKIDSTPVAQTGLIANNSYSVKLGKDNVVSGACGGTACLFNGLIDDVHIYNRALSADEVRQLYSDPYQMFRKRKRLFGVM